MRPAAWCLLPTILAATGCEILGLGSCVTTVSGTVYEDGVPVPGVEVKFSTPSALPPPGSHLWIATAVTDREGRYTVSGTHPSEPNECTTKYVDIPWTSRRALGLTTAALETVQQVRSGVTQTGYDFHFSRDVWYLGVRTEIRIGTTPLADVPDTVEMAVGEIVDLTASFAATDAPDPGGTHRDEVDWLWDGNPQWSWESSGDAPMDDLIWDEYHTYTPPLNKLSFLAEGEGDFVVVWSLDGSPFTDTIRIRVVEPE